MKRICLIIISFGCFTNVWSQIIDLSKSQGLVKPPVYVLDFVQVDSVILVSLEIERKDIKQIKTNGDTILVSTKLLAVLNGKILDDRDEKRECLSGIDKCDIKSIVKLDKAEAVKEYGKRGKKGVLLINTKKE
jgi:hypothetical protein